MVDWASILDNVGQAHDRDELKSQLSLEHVCAVEYGLTFEERAGRLVALCPFHEDTNPSFAIWGDDLDRVGCWACGWRGDVFDIIQASRGCSFREALAVGAQLLSGLDEGSRRKSLPTRGKPSASELRIAAQAAYVNALNDPTPIQWFLEQKNLTHLTPEYLRSEWFVGVASYAGLGAITIPHLGPEREFLGYKMRNAVTPTTSALGSKFTELYGVWRDRGLTSVIVCEGESDTWSCARWFGERADVLGLPTGAQTRIVSPWISRLAYRDVYLVFDGDTAGRDAAGRWQQALHSDSYLISVDLPDGEDATSLGEERLRQLIKEARG